MTCIVGLKDRKSGLVYLGGDSQGTCGHNKIERLDKKVFIRHRIAYGFTDSFRMGQILQHHSEDQGDKISQSERFKDPFGYVVRFLIPHYREILKEHGYLKIHNNEETGGHFLIGFDYSIFHIESDFQVGEVKDEFTAIGSGANFAIGSLDTTESIWSHNPRLRIRQAIRTAAKFNTTVGGKINIVKV